MSDAGNTEYVPDHLYDRLLRPWMLPEDEHPLCKEDWARVDAVTWLPWTGTLLDFGAGDGALAAFVAVRNPKVQTVVCVETDATQHRKAETLWSGNILRFAYAIPDGPFDGALCCEVLEHLTPEEGAVALANIRRAMKPGAMLCVTVPLAGGSREHYPGHVRSFTWKELGDTLRSAGFTLDPRTTRDILGIWIMGIADA